MNPPPVLQEIPLSRSARIAERDEALRREARARAWLLVWLGLAASLLWEFSRWVESLL